MLASIPGGIAAIRGVRRCRAALDADIDIIAPSDAGHQEECQRGRGADLRTHRPIAQLDVEVTIVESTVIDEEMSVLHAHFEPRQLEVATPDGPIVAINVFKRKARSD